MQIQNPVLTQKNFIALAEQGQLHDPTADRLPFNIGSQTTHLSRGLSLGYTLPDIAHYYRTQYQHDAIALTNFNADLRYELTLLQRKYDNITYLEQIDESVILAGDREGETQLIQRHQARQALRRQLEEHAKLILVPLRHHSQQEPA